MKHISDKAESKTLTLGVVTSSSFKFSDWFNDLIKTSSSSDWLLVSISDASLAKRLVSCGGFDMLLVIGEMIFAPNFGGFVCVNC